MRLNKKARIIYYKERKIPQVSRYEIDKKRGRKGIHWFLKYIRNITRIVLRLREKPKHGLF